MKNSNERDDKSDVRFMNNVSCSSCEWRAMKKEDTARLVSPSAGDVASHLK